MHAHPYILQPYNGRNSRYTCPECGKVNQFSKYINTETGEVLNDIVGKCNRIDKCGYHHTPKQYFQDTSPPFRGVPQEGGVPPKGDTKGRGVSLPNWGDVRRTEGSNSQPITPSKPEDPSYIDGDTFKASLKEYDNNNLLKFLRTIFTSEQVNRLTQLYNIGTSSRIL